jgi:hypothetical protein
LKFRLLVLRDCVVCPRESYTADSALLSPSFD